MFNLLPKTEKKLILKEYRLRLVIVVLSFLFLSSLLAILFLLPMYVISNQRESIARSNFDFFSKSIDSKDEKELLGIVSGVKTKTTILKQRKSSYSVRDLLDKVIDKKIPNIKIASVTILENKNQNLPPQDISVFGEAKSRADLLSFTKKLEEDESVEKVELPISNYAKDSDISFSLIVVLKNTK